MKYTFLLLFAVLFSCKEQHAQKENLTTIASAEVKQSEVETVYYLIRHAEKNRGREENPSLTKKGKARAEHWAKVFKNTHIDLVYSSNFNRTIETATPTANMFSTQVKTYNIKELYNIHFQKETKGKTVLVVGHSDTTPQFVNLILNEEKYKDIDDSNNSNLYKVVIYKDGKIKSTLTKHAL